MIGELAKDALLPSAAMSELDDVTMLRVELIDDAPQEVGAVLQARWTLKKKAAHLPSELGGDRLAKIFDQSSCHGESLLVCDDLVDFDGIDKSGSGLTAPRLDCRRFRPRIEGRVQFDSVEFAAVMFKPAMRWQFARIKKRFPMPIKPARTSDMNRGRSTRLQRPARA